MKQRKIRRRPGVTSVDGDMPQARRVSDTANPVSPTSPTSSPSRRRRAGPHRGAALCLLFLTASAGVVGSADASEVSRRRPLDVPLSPASAVAATAASAARVVDSHRPATSSVLPSPSPSSSRELSQRDGADNGPGSETGSSVGMVEVDDSVALEGSNSTDPMLSSPPPNGIVASERAEHPEAEVEAESTAKTSTDLDWASRTALAHMQSSSFMVVLAVSCVALAPAPALSARLGTDRAMSLLSSLAAITAAVEIALSPVLGSVLDSFGRKRAMVVAQFTIVAAHALAALEPDSILTICLAKAAALLCGGQLFVISQTMIADLTASRPERLSAVMGTQSALISAGFLSGAILGGRLAERGLRLCYGTSAILAAAGALNFLCRMPETLPEKDRVPFDRAAARRKIVEAPISCTKLLVGHGAAMRMLSILLVLQSIPINMGDVFQVFTSKEWGLKPRDFSSFVALVGLVGIVSNAASRVLIPRIGLKRFTLIATLSSLAFPIGTFFSFRGALVGACMGCLASAQKLGIMAAIAAQGTKAGVPQGQLAGERASLLALLKVIGPVLYSALYRRGTKMGMSNLPFVFNMGLSVAAMVLCQKYLE